MHLGKGRPGDFLYVHYPPDPVNVRTGNFYLPLQDYYQPCYDLPLEIHRSYNSFYNGESAFGKGWIFNYSVKIVFDPKKGLQVMESDGFVTSYQPKEQSSQNLSQTIESIVSARKKQDAKDFGREKSSAFYQKLKKRLADEASYRKKQEEIYLNKKNRVSKKGEYVSLDRGESNIYETKNGFIREFMTGQKELFDRNGRLIKIEDGNRNAITIYYNNKNQIRRIQDSCNQFVNFTYDSAEHITTIRDGYGRTLNYKYDRIGRMIYSEALDESSFRYTYNGKNLMTSIDFGGGEKTEISYDSKNNRVTQQRGPGKKVTTYRYGKTKGSSWATVNDNQGENSRYEYFESKHEMVFTDRFGKKTITKNMACCGKPLSILNEKGQGETFTYDQQHRIKTKKNTSGSLIEFEYDDRFHLPSKVTTNGKNYSIYRYDQNGNMVFARNNFKTLCEKLPMRITEKSLLL